MIRPAKRLAAKSSSELSAPCPNRLSPAKKPSADVVERDAQENQEAPENDGVEKTGDGPLGEYRELQEHPVEHFPQAPPGPVPARDFLAAGDQAVFPAQFVESQAEGQGHGGYKNDFFDSAEASRPPRLQSLFFMIMNLPFIPPPQPAGHSPVSHSKFG